MWHYPHFNPIAWQVGPIAIHWYGIMYLLAFATFWCLAVYRTRQPKCVIKNSSDVSDLLYYGALGVIVGGRVGYMVFYDLPHFLSAPWILFQVWDGGMSFHGGLIGVIVAMWLFSRRIHCHLTDLTDFVAPMVPIGLGFGRLGNFINGELFGRITSSPWGMVFPNGGPLPRYPSQLIELFLEGVILFGVLWIFSNKKRPRMQVSALFLIGYALCRITVEFFREPDPQLGFIAFGWLTMGQLLCLPMLLLGMVLFIMSQRQKV